MPKKKRRYAQSKAQVEIAGINHRFRLKGHKGQINQIAWSPDGSILASTSFDSTIRFWDSGTGEEINELKSASYTFCLAWSPNGLVLAVGSGGIIQLWHPRSSTILRELDAQGFVDCVAWSPDGQYLASGSRDNVARIWNANSGELLIEIEHGDWVRSLAWSPKGEVLATGSDDGKIQLWNPATGRLVNLVHAGDQWVRSIAWSPDGDVLAAGYDGGSIQLWRGDEFELTRNLEGHIKGISDLKFSSDGIFLASRALNGIIRLWRTDTWGVIARMRANAQSDFAGLSLHPQGLFIAAPGGGGRSVFIWDIDQEQLLHTTSDLPITQYTSAKIVLIGESNVGKSCLAMRLAEDRYPEEEEHGTTHGMRFWMVDPEKLSLTAAPPPNERREVILWDMGGQGEYRLVHQLFLHDTTTALILFDPTRGQASLDEVEAWNRRLEKQLGGRKAVKFLVGAKQDERSSITDYEGINLLLRNFGFKAYIETSAKNGRGIDELREAIASSIAWDALAKTNRLELFQYIRDEIDRRRRSQDIVVLLSDLEAEVQESYPNLYEEGAVAEIAEQLATQGVIASTWLSTGELALVLGIEKIEQYAGALIIAARKNPQGVPALEERQIASPEVPLPGMRDEHRLPRLKERIVLECVTKLLIEHGICFEHQGLLIFPSLFRATEREIAPPSHSASLYYDFSGAVDNIYASLIAWLVISKGFGRPRLWEDRAEFEIAGRGACGIKKVDRGRGFAHIDVYFEEQTPADLRDLFISFVEDHLHRHDIDVAEHIEMSCPSCNYTFTELDVRERISRGEVDIGCVKCDRRVELASGAAKARQRDPMLAQRTVALRTKVAINIKETSESVTQLFGHPDEQVETDTPIRILHLSDLHFNEGDDVKAKLRPLITDIRDKDGGLGFDRLDYLVISGDLSNRATHAEFEVAHQFISALIKEFELTAQRCIIVPGNHDLSWDENVYTWQPKRKVDVGSLKEGSFRMQGEGYLIRDEMGYPNRFKNFSESLYHPLIQKEYPYDFEQQGVPYLFEDTRIQFLTFNSCWEIDEQFPYRSSINSGAVARGIEKAEEQVANLLNTGASLLRIAVWHHPITGNEKIEKDAFLQQLQKVNVQLVLHGHVHETRPDLIGYHHVKQIHVAGAGSFGAPMCQRPESMPRLYNLLEISRDHKEIKIHTRSLLRDEGAWEGWAVWPGATPTSKLTYYTFTPSLHYL